MQVWVDNGEAKHSASLLRSIMIIINIRCQGLSIDFFNKVWGAILFFSTQIWAQSCPCYLRTGPHLAKIGRMAFFCGFL